jgi:protein-tyrosine kinase
MERIREALKRARLERDAMTRGFGSSSAPAAALVEGAKVADGHIASIRTQTTKVSRDLLLDKRVMSGFKEVSNGYTDAFKILSTQVLQRLRENRWNTLMVTSPGGHEGKTLIAINLALSLAMEVNQTVLLVDADLRNPSVHDYFGLHPSSGLGDYLVSTGTIEEMLIHPDIDNFTLLPGGKPLLNSSEMLGSPKMAELVRELKNRHPSGIMVFDLPPLLSAADVLAFSPYADATLLVVEEGKTGKEDVARAAEMLGASNLIGAVLNKSTELEVMAEKPSGWISRVLKRESH